MYKAPDKINPPLKWVGGKRWQISYIEPLYKESNCDTLVEPFCGGLAISLGLRPKKIVVNDINQQLINFYKNLSEGLVIDNLTFQNEYNYYYKARERFNELIVENKSNSKESSSLFYYLNRTGYNGLCRFNKKGFYNVPFGSYKKINYKYDFSEFVSIFKDWLFSSLDFEELYIEENSFIYADPPYDDSFSNYSKGAFSWEDQIRTAEFLIKHKGPVILVNKATDRIVDLYTKLGYKIKYLSAPRKISCTGDRKKVREIFATNGF